MLQNNLSFGDLIGESRCCDHIHEGIIELNSNAFTKVKALIF